jgi:NAD(P)-dependent dehydrogenase (short-subunit alcohol dehydrogenase family)
MSNNLEKKVWFITGTSRGMGIDFAKAALAAGNAVVATGRNTNAVAKAVGQADDLLVVRLDVTSRADPESAVQVAVERFGRIDVLVNNAANFYAGYFEELTPEQIEQQLATGLIGPMNVTRAVLPVMRKQRSGHILSISSGAGLMGFEFNSAYCAAKFGLEGWMEALQAEVAPFGINTTIVNPGFFRTELLTQESTTYAEPSIEDYADAVVRGPEQATGRRPGQARAGARHDRRPATPAALLHRWRRCNCRGRAKGRRSPGASGSLPWTFNVFGVRGCLDGAQDVNEILRQSTRPELVYRLQWLDKSD